MTGDIALASERAAASSKAGALGSEADLVARARRGEAAAFEQIMRQNNQRLFRTARAILRDEAEAEEVVQETYCRAYRELNRFEGRSGLGTWLTRITINLALGRLRERKRSDRLRRIAQAIGETGATGMTLFGRAAGSGGPEDPETILARRELKRSVERAIDALPQDFRTVFMLRSVEQLSVAETAQLLEIPEETVKSRLHRARGILQRRLRREVEFSLGEVFAFAGRRCDRTVANVLLRLGLARQDE
jgi:RNA polymerase sigma-70 factor (ECF subfamily)